MAEIPVDGLVTGDDDVTRCFWGAGTDDYAAYHDNEWGYPVDDDRRLFEKICLEGFQSGLSWLTILRKRDNFRAAFANFEPDAVAEFGAKDVKRLLDDAGIVRHRGKIEASINNAKRACEMIDQEGSIAAYVWKFEPDAADRPDPVTWSALTEMAITPASKALSKDLKQRGWKFVGPTTAYAFMQSMGIVNDHAEDCDTRVKVESARGRFTRPSR
jgi:DNA-3-methyladenine glycosylase I